MFDIIMTCSAMPCDIVCPRA